MVVPHSQNTIQEFIDHKITDRGDQMNSNHPKCEHFPNRCYLTTHDPLYRNTFNKFKIEESESERKSENSSTSLRMAHSFLPNCDIEPPLIASEIKKEKLNLYSFNVTRIHIGKPTHTHTSTQSNTHVAYKYSAVWLEQRALFKTAQNKFCCFPFVLEKKIEVN